MLYSVAAMAYILENGFTVAIALLGGAGLITLALTVWGLTS